MKNKIEVYVFKRKNNHIEYLILHRIPSKGEWWQPISGSVEEKDKSLLDAATRELLEEIGIAKEKIINQIENYFTFKFIEKGKGKIHWCEEHCFGFEVEPNTKIILPKNEYKEHDKYKWLIYDAAIKILKWESNKAALEKLNKLIAQPNLHAS